MRALGIILTAGLLAGCASPMIDRLVAGAGPDKAADGYRFAAPADPDSEADKMILPLVEARLRAEGLKRMDGAPRYVLEVAWTQRPIAVGATTDTAKPTKERPTVWLSPPGKPVWGSSKPQSICQVALRFVDRKTGEPAYQVRAALQGVAADCTPLAPRLLDAALAQMPLPAGETLIK